MAAMIPSVADAEAPDSERYTFQYLERELPASWTVLHSRRIVLPAEAQSGRGGFESELDFVAKQNQTDLTKASSGWQTSGCRRSGCHR